MAGVGGLGGGVWHEAMVLVGGGGGALVPICGCEMASTHTPAPPDGWRVVCTDPVQPALLLQAAL